MKTSMTDVRDMLSVLSVQGVEARIGEVPGVESVTVNHAAATATVRYDETRLHVGDIKSDVRQRGYALTNEPAPKLGVESEPTGQAPPLQSPVPSPAKDEESAVPTKSDKDAAPATTATAPPKDAGPGGLPKPITPAAAAPASEAASPAATVAAAPEGEEPGPIEKVTAWVREALTGDDKDKPEPPSSPEAEPPKPSAPSPTTAAPAAGHAGHQGHESHAAPGAAPAMAVDMAHEMGHSGGDMGRWCAACATASGSAWPSRCRSLSMPRWAACGRHRRRRLGWT